MPRDAASLLGLPSRKPTLADTPSVQEQRRAVAARAERAKNAAGQSGKREALVVLVYRWHCHCGRVHEAPAAPLPFVRWHLKNGAAHLRSARTDDMLAAMRSGLRKETRWEDCETTHCQECWPAVSHERGAGIQPARSKGAQALPEWQDDKEETSK